MKKHKEPSLPNRKRKNVLNSEAKAGFAFAALPLTGFAVFYVVPFFIMIARTFTDGLAVYASVIESEAFHLAATNSLKFIAVGVPLLMLVSFGIALLLRLSFVRSDVFRAAYVLPLVLPSATVIFFFQIVFENGGIINYILEGAGVGTVDFLESGNAFWVLLFLYIWKNMGYTIILLLAGLSQIPDAYYEVARVNGAGWLFQVRRVTLPMMTPTFFFVMIISIVGTFKSFREAFVLGGNHPDDSIYMLQHFMNNNFGNLNYPRLSVSVVLTFVIIFCFVMVMYSRQKKGGRV